MRNTANGGRKTAKSLDDVIAFMEVAFQNVMLPSSLHGSRDVGGIPGIATLDQVNVYHEIGRL